MHGSKLVLEGQLDDTLALAEKERIVESDEAVRLPLDHPGESARQVVNALGRKRPRARRSLGLCAGELDYFAPLLGIVSDELAEVRDRAGKYHASKVGKPRLQLGISEPRIDLAIELINDLGRRVFGRTEANPLARLETRHEIANGRDIRECL